MSKDRRFFIENIFGYNYVKPKDYRRPITITRGQIQLTIPVSAIKTTGFIKKEVYSLINELTKENLEKLQKKYNVVAEILPAA